MTAWMTDSVFCAGEVDDGDRAGGPQGPRVKTIGVVVMS